MELFAKTAVAVNITNIDLSMDSSGDEHAESEKATPQSVTAFVHSPPMNNFSSSTRSFVIPAVKGKFLFFLLCLYN